MSDNEGSSKDETEESDVDGERNGGVEEEAESSSESSNEKKQTTIPELNENIYKRPFSEYDVDDIDDIIDAVSEINEDAAMSISNLRKERDDLKKENTRLEEKLREKVDEFNTYKQMKSTEQENIKKTASKSVLERALPIRDNVIRALQQENGSIRDGIEIVKRDFDELLTQEGVKIISPESGEEVDPNIHEVMSSVESDLPEGAVVECFQPGYSIEGSLIRPARVSVSG